MKKQNALCALAATFILCISMPSFAEVASREKVARTVSAEELYFYDSEDLRIPLLFEKKIVVRFVESGTTRNDEEKEEYLKNLGALAVESVSARYQRAEYMLTYLSTTNKAEMESNLKRLISDPAIDVAPVFISDGMFSVIDGIYIETITPMAKETIQAGISAMFGSDAMVHEITPVVDERNVKIWHVSFKKLFFLGDKKLPMHMLLVGNMLDRGDEKPAWVKRAFPKFARLQEPVVARIEVLPRSGTVGEGRMVEFTVLMYGKNETEVVVAEEELPTFHDRKFMIKSGDKPPVNGFFEHGNPAPQRTSRTQVGPNTWKITHRYFFNLYAPEPEWTISDVEFPYVHRGKKAMAKVPATTFFVRPHLDEKHKLADIPPAYDFPSGNLPDVPPTLAASTAKWYAPIAKLIGGAENLRRTAFGISALSLLVLLSMCVAYVRRKINSNALSRKNVGVWTKDELETAIAGASALNTPSATMSGLHDVLSAVLSQRFTEISSRNATFQQWKHVCAIPAYANIADRFEGSMMEQLFNDIELRNDMNFSDNDAAVLTAHIDAVKESIRAVAEILRTLPMEEENGPNANFVWA